MDEFKQFLSRGFHLSSIEHEIQLWGIRKNQNVELKGISYHFPDKWEEFNPDRSNNSPRSLRLDCSMNLANTADVPLIWIGTHNANWRELKGTAQVGIITQENDEYKSDIQSVDISCDSKASYKSGMAERLQNLMETSLKYSSTHKSVNKKFTPVQKWVRKSMPEKYIVMDVDLLVGDGEGNPHGLVEIRRSDWANYYEGGEPIDDWWPFFKDRRNYYLLSDTAKKAECESILIHHCKEQLTEESKVGYYTNLEYREFEPKTIRDKYNDFPSEEKSREWLKFDFDTFNALEAVNRLKQL